MGQYTIIECKGCKRLFKIYMYEVYEGDPNYCRECNAKIGKSEMKGGIWYETS